MIIDIVLLGVGLVMLLIGIEVIRVFSRGKRMSTNLPTYNRSIDQSVVDTGIFTRHGMVSKENSRKIKSQSKKSDSYFKSLT